MSRAGDVVFHRPTGETWVVAAVDGPQFYAAGWPESRADVADVDLREACDDRAHRSFVEVVAQSKGARGACARRHRCEVCSTAVSP